MKSDIGNRTSRVAFTLVELLVVVTIIVVLLALLVPAMDRAVYQADLAACAANMKAVGLGATTYAVASRRFWPYRGFMTTTENHGSFPYALNKLSENNDSTTYDDRPMYQDYIPFPAFNDPLAGKLRFDKSETKNSYTNASRLLWFGWRYRIIQGGTTAEQGGISRNVGGTAQTWRAMRKLGDKWSWFGASPFGEPPFERISNLIVSDWDGVTNFGGQGGGNMSSHHDADRLLTLSTWQNQSNGFAVVTGSQWGVANQGRKRGTIDANYAPDDGSVYRLNDIKWDDDRTVSVPTTSSGDGIFDYYWNIPRK
jgi:type II secretory pathway pseudopilin PulG